MKWKQFSLQNGERVAYRVDKLLASKKTKYQSIEILSTKTFDKCLFIDGKPQMSLADDFIFNEGFIHPGLIMHENPSKIFVAGGGGGSFSNEILKHNSVKKLIVCDIDEEAINFYRKFYYRKNEAFLQDPRFELIFQDARGYLEKNDQTFDCILIDLPDPLPNSPSRLHYTKEFYLTIKNVLRGKGLLITQAGRTTFNNLKYNKAIYRTLKTVFKQVHLYTFHVPFYCECWGFIVASDFWNPEEYTNVQIKNRIKKRGLKGLKFYDEHIHNALFTLPKYLIDELSSSKIVITDDKPLEVD